MVVPAGWEETYGTWARRVLRAHHVGGRLPWRYEPTMDQRLADIAIVAFTLFAFYALFSWLSFLQHV